MLTNVCCWLFTDLKSTTKEATDITKTSNHLVRLAERVHDNLLSIVPKLQTAAKGIELVKSRYS